MTSMLEKIKAEAVDKGLREAISQKLQKARNRLENATYDDFKNFSNLLAEARALIDEAEVCFRELPDANPKRKR